MKYSQWKRNRIDLKQTLQKQQKRHMAKRSGRRRYKKRLLLTDRIKAAARIKNNA
jgi:hypothetical protein